MMTAVELLQELSVFNFITFYEHKHKYIFRGNTSSPTSATAILKRYTKPFDLEYQAMKTAQKRGVTQAEIIAEWKASGEAGSAKGTLFHKYAEDYTSNRVFPNKTSKVLKKQMKSFYRKYVVTGRLLPVVSEFVLGDKDLMIAGMIDQLFYSTDDNLFHIYDWKTNKKVDMNSPWKNYFKPPISHVEECEFTKFSLQLDIYKYVLTRNTDLELGKNCIVWINEKNEDFKLIECADMQKEAKKLLGVTSR